MSSLDGNQATALEQQAAALREEAAIEPDAVPATEAKKETQIIAIYGKGGIGKSFTLANLSYMMAQHGQARPAHRLRSQERHDLASVRRPRHAHHHRDLLQEEGGGRGSADRRRLLQARRRVRHGARRAGSGRGCGGRGIIHGFELLEKLGFHEWGFDYVLLDFLGDVVCGGFGLPIARDMCQKVIVVGSNDLQSLYVANNVCSAVEYFRKLGGNVGVAGMVINKDDGTGEAQAFCAAVGIPVLVRHSAERGHPPKERKLRDRRHARAVNGRPMFETLATNVASAPPVRPKPLYSR